MAELRSSASAHAAQVLRYYFYYSMAPILELRKLVKHFPGQQAVREISLVIPRGSFFSLLGPSGCGKTTTLRLIAGFEQPTSGDVLLNGEIVNRRQPYDRNVSTVFQNYALFPHLTARGNVEFGLKRHRATDIDRRVREVLELVSLTGKESRRPAELSGGERQRVALARSLVLQPDVLLLDEPLAALDLKLRESMQEELKRLQRELQLTFVFVTHDQAEAFAMSDRVAVMEGGALVQVGSPEELYLRPATRFVTTFVGRANFIPATFVEGATTARPDDMASRQLSETADPSSSSGAEPSIFVRPERLRLVVGSSSDAVQGPHVRGVIADKTFSGGLTTVRVKLREDAEVSVTCDSASPEARDASVGGAAVVTWQPADATLLDR